MSILAPTPPLVEIAVERLREDILSGELAPGGKLKIDALQTRYGYSSSPLREALNRLTRERLVIADQRRGFRVAPMSFEDFTDITRLRLLLDVQALEQSIDLHDDEWEVRSVAAFYRLQQVESRLPDGPLVLNSEWSLRHKEFHIALLSGATSPRLLDLCSSLFDQAERYRRFTARHRPTARAKANEHQAILDAAVAQNPADARSLLTAHILRTQNNLTLILQQGVTFIKSHTD
ncbi:GntR family transcriptional regulator [Herbiconiux daphne]|uniref:GntR family transcriptional regulator n=1 Tax=Herbiconiux daphne TaxID=2970914 RepID=A0ABT2H700_9MICO|nr:GntR family transcriptional regulator [Herbiconiux daphne]MCS5735736.1 GntR family transcriptional regulator [Herbiconiux daphne]